VYPVDPDKLGIIFPPDVLWATHTVTFDGNIHEARMSVIVDDGQGTQYSVDPFGFRWNSGTKFVFAVASLSARMPLLLHFTALSSGSESAEARRGNGSPWERVFFHSYEWKVMVKGGEVRVKGDAVVNSLMYDSSWQIDCPSLVFAILPEKDKDLYNLVKLVTNFCFGKQSQCLVWKTFQKQKNRDQ